MAKANEEQLAQLMEKHAKSQEQLSADQIAANKVKFTEMMGDQAKMAEAMAKGE